MPSPLGWVDPLGFAPNGKEVGIYGADGFFNKHGTIGSDVKVPKSVSDTLNGIAVDELRKMGNLPPKGTPESRQAVKEYTKSGRSGC